MPCTYDDFTVTQKQVNVSDTELQDKINRAVDQTIANQRLAVSKNQAHKIDEYKRELDKATELLCFTLNHFFISDIGAYEDLMHNSEMGAEISKWARKHNSMDANRLKMELNRAEADVKRIKAEIDAVNKRKKKTK